MEVIHLRGNKGTIAVRRLGRGQPLILIHGLPCDSRIWNPVITELSQTNSLYAIDLPGFGSSPMIHSSEDLLYDLAHTLKEVVTEFELGRPNVVAHSMGGYVLLKAIEAQLIDCNKIVFCACRACSDSEEKKRDREQFAVELRAGRSESFITTQLNACRVVQGKSKLLESIIVSNSSPAMAEVLIALSRRRDFTPTLASVKSPVCFIVGGNDTDFVTESERMSRLLPSSERYVIEGAEHMVFMDAPEAFTNHVSAFLAKETGQ